MARRNKASVLKREREKKKAEKAAAKRELRAQNDPGSAAPGSQVASQEDLASYGVGAGAPETERDRS
jgi:hypothetical protein